MKDIKKLYKEGYVVMDSGFLIEHQSYSHLLDLSIEEAHLNIFEMLKKEECDTLYLYENEDFETLFYISSRNEKCIGRFYKIKNKFENSTFINEKDKEVISNIVARLDCNDQEIKLGDIVFFENGYGSGRVIWVDSAFNVYNDSFEENFSELSNDMKITKLNI